jgi:hypothetical protein
MQLPTNSTKLAEAVLRRLMLGEEVAGLRFGQPQLLFSSGVDKPLGVPYINLASRWKAFESRPTQFPLYESELAELSSQEELQQLLQLRHKTVESIEVLEPSPHLVITFNDGTVFYLNGHNEHYEAWQAGQSFSGDQTWLVVACPEDALTIWAPDEFSPSSV